MSHPYLTRLKLSGQLDDKPHAEIVDGPICWRQSQEDSAAICAWMFVSAICIGSGAALGWAIFTVIGWIAS